MIWFQEFTPDIVQGFHVDTMAGHLEIKITEVGEDYLVAEMPITGRTVQPFRTMHGGASAALAETIGSVASQMTVDPSQKKCVGLTLNVSHIRAIPEGGKAIATARPFHLGRTTHVWDIQIKNEAGKLATVSRLTMSVLTMAASNMERK
ncbi:MAG: hotdog fold thioesterase [Chloroflexota bacterium]